MSGRTIRGLVVLAVVWLFSGNFLLAIAAGLLAMPEYTGARF